jgi:hypothetical protein
VALRLLIKNNAKCIRDSKESALNKDRERRAAEANMFTHLATAGTDFHTIFIMRHMPVPLFEWKNGSYAQADVVEVIHLSPDDLDLIAHEQKLHDTNVPCHWVDVRPAARVEKAIPLLDIQPHYYVIVKSSTNQPWYLGKVLEVEDVQPTVPEDGEEADWGDFVIVQEYGNDKFSVAQTAYHYPRYNGLDTTMCPVTQKDYYAKNNHIPAWCKPVQHTVNICSIAVCGPKERIQTKILQIRLNVLRSLSSREDIDWNMDVN